MKGLITITTGITLLLLFAPSAIPQDSPYTYDDTTNVLAISGTTCRAEDATAEENIFHIVGRTMAKGTVDRIRVFCPLNRRNLSAYSKELDSDRDVVIWAMGIFVQSHTGTLRCRGFAKDAISRTVDYMDWREASSGLPYPFSRYFILWWFSPFTEWESYNWGVMCDIPGGESIEHIALLVNNNNVGGRP